MRVTALVLALLGGLTPLRSEAAEPPYEEPFITVHGFVSPGFILTTPGVNYLADSDGGSAEFTEVGINFTKQLTDELRLGMQLFARDLGDTGNYNAKLDWFYLDYRFADWLGFRAGRVKLPMGLYNDINDIDAAHVPVLLPQSLYPIDNRDVLLAQTGAEIYGFVAMGPAGGLDYRFFGGTIFLPTETSTTFDEIDLNIPYTTGARVLWETPIGLRLGGSLLFTRLDFTAEHATLGSLAATLDATIWIASAELTLDALTIATEFGRWIIATTSSNTAAFPVTEQVSERFYTSIAYRIGEWFTPSLYYSYLCRDNASCKGRANRQHDVALTLRFDVNAHWLWKLEAHYMNGTADLDDELNGGTQREDLPAHWGLFLLKTTAYF